MEASRDNSDASVDSETEKDWSYVKNLIDNKGVRDLRSGFTTSPTCSSKPLQLNNNGISFITLGISTPNKNDVLIGRGGGTNKHPGNFQYRRFIDAQKQEYSKSNQSQKFRFSDRVVQLIRDSNPPGRFLKKNGRFLKKNEMK